MGVKDVEMWKYENVEMEYKYIPIYQKTEHDSLLIIED